MDPITIFSAFIPVLIEGLKQGINYVTGGPKPTSVEDVAKLRELDIRQLEALASLDKAEGASQWVVNVRALIRPAVSIIILIYAGILMVIPAAPEVSQTILFLAQCVIFYLFGERTLSYVKAPGQTPTAKGR